MLQVTDVYLERLLLLRDVGIPLAHEMEEKGGLDFNRFMSYCGTYGCLAGWCGTHGAFSARGLTLSGDGVPCYGGESWHAALRKFFGVDFTHSILNLFGDSKHGGTLSDRAAYLDKLIEERLAKLEVATVQDLDNFPAYWPQTEPVKA